MITRNTILDTVVGKGIDNALIKTLYNQTTDFPDIHRAYLDAIEKLHTTLGPEAKHNIEKYVVAIEQKCASNLYYAGLQGLKMNYEHFQNPMAPNCTWDQVDYDDYIRLYSAYSLPLYEVANRYTSAFEKTWPKELEEVHEAIISYETEFECSGMKLAHFYGYLAGNDLLCHAIPGYYPDSCLDIRYRHMLEKYFGRPVEMSQWEGCINLNTWIIAPIEEYNPQDISIIREELRTMPNKF
jgi:hypothetical protein